MIIWDSTGSWVCFLSIGFTPDLQHIHGVLHISLLKANKTDNHHVLNYEPWSIQSNLIYEEKTVEIVNLKFQELRNKKVKLRWFGETGHVKVRR